jgi:hypothetical protein
VVIRSWERGPVLHEGMNMRLTRATWLRRGVLSCLAAYEAPLDDEVGV